MKHRKPSGSNQEGESQASQHASIGEREMSLENLHGHLKALEQGWTQLACLQS